MTHSHQYSMYMNDNMIYCNMICIIIYILCIFIYHYTSISVLTWQAAELEHPLVGSYGPGLRPEGLRRLLLSKVEELDALKAVERFLTTRDCGNGPGLFNLSQQVRDGGTGITEGRFGHRSKCHGLVSCPS